jgi:DNA-binding XRE family transcriptional regulator
VEAFWKQVAIHYNNNRPNGGQVCPARSLESKWGMIKRDVARFIGIYKQVYNNKESGTSLDDVLRDALELYKVWDAQQHAFVYLHCWIVLKDIPRWMD